MIRSLILIIGVIVVFVVFALRLINIQLIDKRYTLDAANNAQRIEKIYAPRGIMRDRNGVVLATNQIAYDVEVISSRLSNLDTARLAEVLQEPLSSVRKQLKKARIQAPYRPFAILRGLMIKDYAALQEKVSIFEGVSMRKRTFRKYPQVYGGNVMGYVGEVNDYVMKSHPEYDLGDYLGISGIESSYEEVLRGVSGRKYIVVDNRNRDVGSFANGEYDMQPVMGAELTLTIDAKLQALGEELMRGKRGSIVAIEPSTGEILALLSAPSYDPNALVGRYRSRNYTVLSRDSVNKPLYDRAILAEYPPGSPFKILNALIGLQEGVVTNETQYTCIDGFHFGSLHVGCHCKAGTLDLRGSISKSCNNYHCQILKKVLEKYPSASQGIDSWHRHIKSFGMGDYLGVDLPTGRKGFVPDGSYFNKVYQSDRWKAPTVISLAIGQGELAVTPIQLANMVAALANRGWWIRPHVVRAIDQKAISDEQYTKVNKTTIDPQYFEVIIGGMNDVFESGTARASRLEGLMMAGKTGTAQNPHGQDHSIFTSFAPLNKPKIAIAIIVENGYWGSRWAAPIASLMMESYLHDSISRPDLYRRMVEGSLTGEYRVNSVQTALPPY